MKKTLSLVLAMAMLLAIPAFAAEPKIVSVVPDIEFDGTTAECMVLITADKLTDTISATMELWYGDQQLAIWGGNGNGYLRLTGYEPVERNATYDLVVTYSVNGVTRTPISISRTCY